jgi:hypothetical protein
LLVFAGGPKFEHMFFRAEIWSVLALVAGVLALSGCLGGGVAAVAEGVAFLCAGLCALSLLFGLFEPADDEGQSLGDNPAGFHSRS